MRYKIARVREQLKNFEFFWRLTEGVWRLRASARIKNLSFAKLDVQPHLAMELMKLTLWPFMKLFPVWLIPAINRLWLASGEKHVNVGNWKFLSICHTNNWILFFKNVLKWVRDSKNLRLRGFDSTHKFLPHTRQSWIWFWIS